MATSTPGGQPRRDEREEAADQPVSTLRGAGVDVDVRRVVGVLAALVLVGLAVLVVVLVVAGVHRNDQISRLRTQGVDVTVTVSGCQGLLGGSGSNAAGYACRGDLTLGGHTYNEAIPGSTLYRPGTTLRVVAVPGDPALLSPVHLVQGEHSSPRVFLLPGILAVVLLAALGLLVYRRRRAGRSPGDAATT